MHQRFPILTACLAAVITAVLSYAAYPLLMDWILGDARQHLVILKPAETF
ncbi:hypothetical protein SAMN02745181_0579 [Rubritalea squalenifaciens DSM 18772]|uniref:Uncharacterized protein n=1 Tax=Rubritalea squalenifaciens DSM 18772 TaxID=1123071 RepID=A0A1M6CW16_9BACT|nr:hypothetical protein [Rubritalea squalenifaciens]SHI65041.1 hypothetical protein SAMN02745181_0579 [Rubritalea squalenifaciens DSM 18772]